MIRRLSLAIRAGTWSSAAGRFQGGLSDVSARTIGSIQSPSSYPSDLQPGPAWSLVRHEPSLRSDSVAPSS